MAISLANLGFLFAQIGGPTDALPPIRRAAELQEGLVRNHPDVVGYRGELATSLAGLGSLQRQAGKTDEAMRSLRRALELWETLPLGQPNDLYNLACVHAQCIALIDGGHRALSAAEREEREFTRRAGDGRLAAVSRLRLFPPTLLQQDTDLDPIRFRPDFRALLDDLAFPADPFAPAEPPDPTEPLPTGATARHDPGLTASSGV